MNEEEKKAIEKEAGELENLVDIKYHLEQWKNESKKGTLDECHLVEEDIEIMELAVNIIEKQKAEIERLKNIISNTSVQFINDTIKTDKKNKEDIEALNEVWEIELEKKNIEYSDLKLKYEQNLRMCKHFREELNKQDKIIDEMTYYLSDFDIDEMCEKCDRCIGNGCYADDDMEFKINCIKQYFKEKVENGN